MPAPPTATRRSERAWYLDAASSIAFFLIALLLSKSVARIFGVFGGLFFLVMTAGVGYQLAKSAWRGFTEKRNKLVGALRGDDRR